MIERSLIQNHGFKNIYQNGSAIGIQILIRCPNYRGVTAPLIDGVDVTIGKHRFEYDAANWTLKGQTFSFNELRQADHLHWGLDELATLSLPLEGGLAEGIHEVSVSVYIRRPYIPGQFCRSPFRQTRKIVLVDNTAIDQSIKLGVSTYSYTDDFGTVMTLEDIMADTHDIGAKGFEILGESNITGYPTPSSQWLDQWHSLLEKYQLTPTNYGAWVDSPLWFDRNMSVEQECDHLSREIILAKTLGFTSIRPKFAVTTYDLDPVASWSKVVSNVLPLAEKHNVVICPEIHSPTPIQHRVTQDYIRFIEDIQNPYFKLLIDTGIFQLEPCDDGHDGIEVEKGKRPPFLEPLKVPMKDLAEVLPHTHFIQAKFFEIDDQLNDLHIPWYDIIKTLKDNNWSGWLSSEYEGRRELYRGKDQVRRQHALLRLLLNQ